MIFLRSKIMLALIGLFVIGGGSAAIAIATAPKPATSALALAGKTGSAASATATATSQPKPTATSRPAPTSPPAPPTTQTVDLRGTIANVSPSAGTFSMYSDNFSATVIVNSSTSFSGSASSLSGLQSGWKVEVQGTTQANGNVVATSVLSSVSSGDN